MQIKAITIRFDQAVNYFIKAAEIFYFSDLQLDGTDLTYSAVQCSQKPFLLRRHNLRLIHTLSRVK